MNTHDEYELPPLPYVAFCRVSDIDPNDSHHRQLGVSADTRLYTEDQVRAAIELYQRRIEELESQLEAIGAGGVSSQRITSQRGGEPVARVNDDGFIVETGLGLAPGTLLYTAPQPAEPDGTLTNEGTKSDDPVGGEYPSNEWVTAFFGSPDDSGFYYFRGDFGNIAHRYINSAKHLLPQPTAPVVKDSLTVAEQVRVPQHLIERLQRHCEDKSNTAFSRSTMREALQYLTAEPSNFPSDDEVLEAMRPSLDEGDGGYVCDMSPMHVIASGRALLARYGSKS